jgi:large subunit ribosomal protein L17
MRHGKKFNHLGRTTSHRKAMLANMASSLILHKRITTTIAKAKALRMYAEPILTKSKNDTTHSRRTVFKLLQNKEVLTILFREVAEKIATRPGGYTRIVKLGNRLGDNEIYNKEAKIEKKATRRRGGGSGTAKAAIATDAAVENASVIVDDFEGMDLDAEEDTKEDKV